MITVLFVIMMASKPILITDIRIVEIRKCYGKNRVPGINGSYSATFETDEGKLQMFGGSSTGDFGIVFKDKEDFLMYLLDAENARVLSAIHVQTRKRGNVLLSRSTREYWSDGSKESQRPWFAARFNELMRIAERACNK